jgi:membrane protein implicated in regulation of membrane protease activity
MHQEEEQHQQQEQQEQHYMSSTFLLLIVAACGFLKLLFVSDIILCSGCWYNVLCSSSLSLSLVVFALCPLSLIWFFVESIKLKENKHKLRKGTRMTNTRTDEVTTHHTKHP